MFILENIVGKGLLKLETVVELLKSVEKKDNLFANFLIDATIQDSSKRKRSDAFLTLVLIYIIILSLNKKQTLILNNIKNLIKFLV